MFKWIASSKRAGCPPTVEASEIADPTPAPPLDTSETRRGAEIDLLDGISRATDSNLILSRILRDAFGIVDELAAFSTSFNGTAERARTRAEHFATSVSDLRGKGALIENGLTTASAALDQTHVRSRSALASVQDLTGAIGEIERVVQTIAAIAAQTDLLALKSTIEAARAGPAGAGFRIVAGEVKALSQQTQRATEAIVSSVRRIRERAYSNMTEVQGIDEAVESLNRVFGAMRTTAMSQVEQTRDISIGSEEIAAMAQTVQTSADRMESLGGKAKRMTISAEGAASDARHAFGGLADRASIVMRLANLDDEDRASRWPIVLNGTLSRGSATVPVRTIDISANTLQFEASPEIMAFFGEILHAEIETLGRFKVRLMTMATSGLEAIYVDLSPTMLRGVTEEVSRLRDHYAPFIDRVRDVASEATALIHAAIAAGDMSEAQLFDIEYRLEEGSDPPKYWNAAIAPLEACVRSLVEREIAVHPMPDFCILQDRNGFNPIHNLRYSLPARPFDPVYNQRHSRARRLFKDKAGMASARNLRPFQVQSYARDMGDGVIMVCKEFNAPIFILGRHWGTIRMGYKLS